MVFFNLRRTSVTRTGGQEYSLVVSYIMALV